MQARTGGIRCQPRLGKRSASHRKSDRQGSEWIAASEDCDGFGSFQTHYVSISPQEDRGGTAGTVGEGPGGEEEIGVEGTVKAHTIIVTCGKAYHIGFTAQAP